MEHVVFFPTPDGTPAFRRVGGLEDAVRLVEHLRNVEGVQEVSVHPLGAEVPLAFRAWYRVEVPAEAAVVPPQQTVDGPATEPVEVYDHVEPPAPAAVTAGAQDGAAAVPAEDNGHKPAVTSLGFFAT